jgi:hypothetical protein
MWDAAPEDRLAAADADDGLGRRRRGRVVARGAGEAAPAASAVGIGGVWEVLRVSLPPFGQLTTSATITPTATTAPARANHCPRPPPRLPGSIAPIVRVSAMPTQY